MPIGVGCVAYHLTDTYMYNIHIVVMIVLEIDNLILKTYLADVSTGCSSPPQGTFENYHHHFMSTAATEKPESLRSYVL